MFKKISTQKSNIQKQLNGIKIIIALSTTSMLFTNGVIAREINTPTQIPVMATTINYAPARQVPDGYVKGNYKAVATPYPKTKKVISPKANEISLQEAAEIAAQEVYRFFGEKITDQKINCCYCPKEGKLEAIWSINIKINEDYIFIIDMFASTGELHHISCFGGPNVKKFSTSEDEQILKNGMAEADKGLPDPDGACAKAKDLITQKGYIAEPIETIKYEFSTFGTVTPLAHPYSRIAHCFTIVTSSKKEYSIEVSQDLSFITRFNYVIPVNK